MKIKDLLQKVKEFKDLLSEHRELFGKSLDDVIPSFPVKNFSKLEEQQKQLFKLFYPIDEYLTQFSKGRKMYHPLTGITWEVYTSAIGNNVAQIKGPSLDTAALDLEGIISLLGARNQEEEIILKNSTIKPKKVFISHGKETKALDKIEKYLADLGVEPVVLKRNPSMGKALDDLVDSKMSECLAMIVLATKDDEVQGEKVEKYFQPRPNVVHEIGLAQEKLNNKIVYLKEVGCIFPSNIQPKVWENFTQDNMEAAFSKIARELKSFGII